MQLCLLQMFLCFNVYYAAVQGRIGKLTVCSVNDRIKEDQGHNVAIWKHAAVLVFRSLQSTTVINVDCTASVVLIANLNLNRLQPDPPLSPPSFHALTLVT